LEKEKLEQLAKNNEKLKDKTGNYKNKNNTKFLNSIAILKKKQEYELKQLEILRLMILKQYPEFSFNLLPTIYVTTISKDLEYTSQFYDKLNEIKPLYCDGIEFIEQIVRFLKHYKYNNGETNKHMFRILLACNKDYKNRELLLQLINKGIFKDIDINITMPLIDMDNKTTKFMAVEFFPNDIMKYFMQIQILENKKK